MRAGDYRPVTLPPDACGNAGATRAWLACVHPQLLSLIPNGDGRRALLTSNLSAGDGGPRDVFKYFGVRPENLHTIVGNLYGLMHTAQAAGADAGPQGAAAPWPGFEDVWVPVRAELELSARLGLARDGGKVRTADCVVLIPGLMGDNNVKRTREIARALRSAGFHVLAVELRGAGRTHRRYPHVRYTFGTLEVGDLLAVSEWLEDRPEVRRTGLIGYCWGANLALLCAWEDGRMDEDPDIDIRLRPYLRPRNGRRHYQAGILAFSPVLRFEEMIETLDQRRWPRLENPVLDTLQTEIETRMQREQFPEVSGSLRRLIELEYERSELSYPQAVPDGLRYLRLMPSRDRTVGQKLETARVPVLIVHAANDPLSPAQDVADFIATIDNPQVAAMVLPGGGHVGFVPYARAYTYSLMLNFFHPQYGAAACSERGDLASQTE